MSDYFTLKLLHILSSTLLFGTGLGTAFFQWMALRSGDVRAIAVTARHTVIADWCFTLPAVIVQPLTGALLVQRLHLPWDTPWLVSALALYLVAGACWLPVVVLQIRARDLAEAAVRNDTALPAAWHRAMRWWFWLGWPAFVAVLATFWLMVMKPPLWWG